MRLVVQSSEMPILGSDYGAVQTIEDGNGIYVLQFDSVEDNKIAYESLSSISGVIEEDRVISLVREVTVEAKTDTQAFQYRAWGAQRIGADQWIENMIPEQKQQEVVVAVLDTGISSSHADFRRKLLDGISMLDKDIFVQHSHGTHVAGNVKILPDQVLDQVTGRGTTLSAGSGVQWASEHGAELLCVSAIDSKEQLASFSNYGSAVDLAVLGVSIQSVVPKG